MNAVQLVGILNVTPDSFSDGGQFFNPEKAIKQANQLFTDGASFIDIGAESTNPWSSPLKTEEEWSRLEPVLKQLVSKYPGKLSIDTYHWETAEKALQAGVTIVNDVTMFRDPKMIEVAAKHRAFCIISHLSSRSPSIADAHKNPQTTTVSEVVAELLEKQAELIQAGIPSENIILDPGIGFGKTMELNRQLLEFAKKVPSAEVMIGYSRKRFLGENRMNIQSNLEAGKIAIVSGARYLRVHDVGSHAALVNS